MAKQEVIVVIGKHVVDRTVDPEDRSVVASVEPIGRERCPVGTMSVSVFSILEQALKPHPIVMDVHEPLGIRCHAVLPDRDPPEARTAIGPDLSGHRPSGPPVRLSR